VKSFRIPKKELKLSKEARERVFAIRTPTQARAFLRDFGSHYPSDVSHLGGILWREIEIKTKQECDFSELESAASKEIDLLASAGYPGSDFGAGVSISTKKIKLLGKATGSKLNEVEAVITSKMSSLGPSTTNPQLFTEFLLTNSQNWRIINRGEISNLIPVWTIIERDHELAEYEVANLLRREWIQMASSSAWISTIRFEIDRTNIELLDIENIDRNGSPEEINRHIKETLNSLESMSTTSEWLQNNKDIKKKLITLFDLCCDEEDIL